MASATVTIPRRAAAQLQTQAFAQARAAITKPGLTPAQILIRQIAISRVLLRRKIRLILARALVIARRLCPVDTGYLKSTLRLAGDALFAAAEYASYVERRYQFMARAIRQALRQFGIRRVV